MGFRNASESEQSKGQKRFKDEDDFVPIHWMGSSKVETMLVRRSTLGKPNDDATSRSKKTRKAAADRKQSERDAWRRLAVQSKRFADRYEAFVDDDDDAYAPMPGAPATRADAARTRMLSHLRPPRLHRLESRQTECEARGEVGDEAPLPQHPTDRQPSLRRQPSAAASMVRSAYRSANGGALCPFSGETVPLRALAEHMDEWRRLMLAELMSLKADPICGPRVGLFAVPPIPEDAPHEGSSEEEIRAWGEQALELYKEGYICVRPHNTKHHWSELRKILSQPLAPYRPWEETPEQREERLDKERAEREAEEGGPLASSASFRDLSPLKKLFSIYEGAPEQQRRGSNVSGGFE